VRRGTGVNSSFHTGLDRVVPASCSATLEEVALVNFLCTSFYYLFLFKLLYLENYWQSLHELTICAAVRGPLESVQALPCKLQCSAGRGGTGFFNIILLYFIIYFYVLYFIIYLYFKLLYLESYWQSLHELTICAEMRGPLEMGHWCKSKFPYRPCPASFPQIGLAPPEYLQHKFGTRMEKEIH
jgi:hypothetical protein